MTDILTPTWTRQPLYGPFRLLTFDRINFSANFANYLKEELADSKTVTLLQVKLSELEPFRSTLAKQELDDLTGSHLYTLAQRLLSFFEDAPTAKNLMATNRKELPIRFDILLQNISRQPPVFLSSYLRNVAEWFGIEPNVAIYEAWRALTKGKKHVSQGNELQLPQPLQSYHQHGLLAIIDGHLLIPLSVLAAWQISSKLPDWDELPALLHHLRHTLISTPHESLQQRGYRQVTSFLLNGNPTLAGHQYRVTRSRGMLVDLSRFDWRVPISSAVIDATLVALEVLFEQDHERYRQLFNRVHGRLWEEVGRAIAELERIKQSLPTRPVLVDARNWHRSCQIVSERLKSISDAYAVLTEFEQSLGIDRYLGSKAVAPDLQRVHALVREVGQQVQKILDHPRQLYLKQWNLAQIVPTILSLLGRPSVRSTISDYLPSDQQRVIFVLVDGLGYTQFNWFLRTIAGRAATPLAGNIFAWLKEQGFFNESYLLASNLVTVTGTCLPTIYTGALPKKTGIIGSHMRMGGRKINVLKGRDESYPQRKLSGQRLVNFYHANTGRVTSLVDIADSNGVEVNIFHGGHPDFEALTQVTYGKRDRDSKLMHIVPKADRIFAEAANKIERWVDRRKQKQLALIYYPIIDSSGHSCGPYTQFQASQLAKLNFLFTHFLIDLVERGGPLFDGKTSLVITADHGMFESNDTVVNDKMIRRAAGGALPRSADIIYDNRACHIYGVPDHQLEHVRNKLAMSFNRDHIPIVVRTKYDKVMGELLYDPHAQHKANCPDLILQFYGPGIFYWNTSLESHRFLYGAHGGCSVDETFVPFIHFSLTAELATQLKRMY